MTDKRSFVTKKIFIDFHVDVSPSNIDIYGALWNRCVERGNE